MTTFQDPPLQSRRASRQGERTENSAPPFTPPQLPRSAAGVGEPLNYVTQNRPPLPGYDGSQNRGRRAAEPPREAPAGPPEPQAPAFRPRDFSPEARTAPPAWAPDYDRSGAVADDGVVDYHTHARASVVVPEAVRSSLAASLAGEPSEQTLSRRELRAIREAAGIQAAPPTDPALAIPQPQAYVAPAPAASPEPAPSRRTLRAPVEPAPEDGLSAFEALYGQPAPTATPQPAPQQYAQPQPAPQQFIPQPASAPVTAPPVTAPPVTAPPVEQIAPATGERPVGHWTNQADIDDRVQSTESTISRTVGSGAITTSALVLPSIPGHDMSTGEVMLTDSISLPSTFAATGAHHSIDESDIDHLLDPGDHQLVNTDSVPIRAIKAVSSHTGSRALLTAQKPNRSNRALTILIASASGMVVVVVTLLVVALATGVL